MSCRFMIVQIALRLGCRAARGLGMERRVAVRVGVWGLIYRVQTVGLRRPSLGAGSLALWVLTYFTPSALRGTFGITSGTGRRPTRGSFPAPFRTDLGLFAASYRRKSSGSRISSRFACSCPRPSLHSPFGRSVLGALRRIIYFYIITSPENPPTLILWDILPRLCAFVNARPQILTIIFHPI